MVELRGRRLGIAALAVLAALLVVAPVGRGAELTPDEYTERAEPICKTNVEANKQIFKGTKGAIKRGELKKAAGSFSRATTAFGRTIRELAAIPQPTGSEQKLGKWLDLLRDEKDIIKKIGLALKAEKRAKAESYSVELNRNTNKANNAVLSFGFDYCRLDSARFG
jgi:hypothetical protein